MKCLKCDSTNLKRKRIRFSPEVKGINIDVVVEAMVCEECHTPVMDSSMMNDLRRAAADKYRADQGLLGSLEIRTYRESLGMSQSAFARYLNVGEASIKRWETYYVQDAGQDEHIRLKCDEAYSELNFLDVYWKTHKPDVFSGGKQFNLQLFKNVALYLVSKTKESIIILNKLHFFLDFLHYKRFGESLTGARYIPLKYGPCPDQYRALYECLGRSGVITSKNNHGFEANVAPDLSMFDDHELETLEFLVKIYKKKGGKYLYDLSHGEKGFVDTKECDFISYDYARDLKL